MAHSGFFWQWELAIEVALENENLYLETSRVPGFETGKSFKSWAVIKSSGGQMVPSVTMNGSLTKSDVMLKMKRNSIKLWVGQL